MTAVVFPYPLDNRVLAAAHKVRLVLFDVDGVLTDGSLYLDAHGQEYKAFYARDGHGLKMLQRTGVEVGIITGRRSDVVDHRARDLGIHLVFQGCLDKLAVYNELRERRSLDPATIAFVGDDVVDLPVMTRVGLAVAVQDAHYLVKQHAHWITPHGGGRGAARDVCELLMHAQGHYEHELGGFLT
ncbi:MAG TPA: HAD-IIIA family hydrolase [Acidiferrobacteraceae bacterium]|nr:HAD-IIIA family hydrolase [Acidiferrobacteraceae bacterium]